jgi:hypothetical protein
LDVADDVPPAFFAVTTTRSVEPASALVSTRVLACAPAMFEQAAPERLQRRH